MMDRRSFLKTLCTSAAVAAISPKIELFLNTMPDKAFSDPAGRLAIVSDMLEAGLITPEDGLRLLNFPDMETSL